MNATPTVIIPFNYSSGLAFEGKNAAKITELLTTARIVTQTTRHGKYDWYLMDPDEEANPMIQFLISPLDEREASRKIREELAAATDLLGKHADMIAAAESLNP